MKVCVWNAVTNNLPLTQVPASWIPTWQWNVFVNGNDVLQFTNGLSVNLDLLHFSLNCLLDLFCKMSPRARFLDSSWIIQPLYYFLLHLCWTVVECITRQQPYDPFDPAVRKLVNIFREGVWLEDCLVVVQKKFQWGTEWRRLVCGSLDVYRHRHSSVFVSPFVFRTKF